MSNIKNMNNMNNDYVIRRSQINSQGQTSNDINIQSNHPSFGDVLNKIKSNDSLKFSKHAMERLNSRNIELSDSEINRITDGVDKAKSKGVREALIMMDNKVFIASVSNKTIITAAMDEQLKDNVFTNIDGAVIV